VQLIFVVSLLTVISRICERLRELGYADEVEFINDTRPEILSEHSLVKSEIVLTDRGMF
jgi:hypothetical protein